MSECLNRVIEAQHSDEELERRVECYLTARVKLDLITSYHKAHLKKLKKALSELTVTEFKKLFSEM